MCSLKGAPEEGKTQGNAHFFPGGRHIPLLLPSGWNYGSFPTLQSGCFQLSLYKEHSYPVCLPGLEPNRRDKTQTQNPTAHLGYTGDLATFGFPKQAEIKATLHTAAPGSPAQPRWTPLAFFLPVGKIDG